MGIPVSTYRLQANYEFPLREINLYVDYLKQLGVGCLYISPLQVCRKKSLHGYDVVDHTELDPELGDESELRVLSIKLQLYGMGLIIDVVPNHMCIASPDNFLWQSVLKEGKLSPYSNYFDIIWGLEIPGFEGKILQPFLGEKQKDEISKGNLKISRDKSYVEYYKMRYPLSKELCSTENDLSYLLKHQHYWLDCWRMGCDLLNYRRFFDVSDLACLRVEEMEVFMHVHQLIKKWCDEGIVDGVRVDHIDGLRDPKKYCEQLKALIGNCYVAAEKILVGNEQLRRSWNIEGTTGYDFLNILNGLFVDWDQFNFIVAFYNDYVGNSLTVKEEIIASKRAVINLTMQSEVRMLSYKLQNIDVTYNSEECAEGITALLIAFPVYRTYMTDDVCEEVDRLIVEQAIDEARKIAATKVSSGFWSWISSIFSERGTTHALDFVLSFQQMSGAIMAKGVEDTFNYRRIPLCSLNEVGSDPETEEVTVDSFHIFNQIRVIDWPQAMLATSTHDTKRSEDVRARLNVLSEDAVDWKNNLLRWSEHNRKSKKDGCPDCNDEYMLYQTLIGTWSNTFFEQKALLHYHHRIEEYFIKALREAKRHTSWINPNHSYEETAKLFLRQILIEDTAFLSMLAGYVDRIAPFGYMNSLSQTLIKMTAPGIPDFYQGSELWLFTLVDPDNRSHINYNLRQEMLNKIDTKVGLKYTQDNITSGLVKIDLIHKGLHCRNNHQMLFQKGDYIPLKSSGRFSENIIAYARVYKSDTVIIITSRWLTKLNTGCIPLAGMWENTSVEIPENITPDAYIDCLQNKTLNLTEDNKIRRIFVADIFVKAPLAMLESL